MPSRTRGSASPSMWTSSAVRSSRGRSSGSLKPPARMCSQYPERTPTGTSFQTSSYSACYRGPCGRDRTAAGGEGSAASGYALGVPSLDDVVRQYTELAELDREWLHRLVAEWQMLADLSFADLVLWVPDREGLGFWACAQMRPTTGPTAHLDDLVGSFVPRGRRQLLDTAYDAGRICREGDPEWRDEVPVRVESIPVRRAGRILGVITRNTNLLSVRTPSRLELTYLKTAADLAQMISEG